MGFYFKIMDPARHRFPGTPSASMSTTPNTTPLPSRSSSPIPDEKSLKRSTTSGTSRKGGKKRPRARSRSNVRSSSLFHEVYARLHENPVGIFESQRYLNLETRFAHPDADEVLSRMMKLLGDSAADLLGCCSDALDYSIAWFDRMGDTEGLFSSVRLRKESRSREIFQSKEIGDNLLAALIQFKSETR